MYRKKFYMVIFMVFAVPIILLTASIVINQFVDGGIGVVNKLEEAIGIKEEEIKVLSKEEMLSIGRSALAYENNIYKIEDVETFDIWLRSLYIEPGEFEKEKRQVFNNYKEKNVIVSLIAIRNQEKVSQDDEEVFFNYHMTRKIITEDNLKVTEEYDGEMTLEEVKEGSTYKIKDHRKTNYSDTQGKLTKEELELIENY